MIASLKKNIGEKSNETASINPCIGPYKDVLYSTDLKFTIDKIWSQVHNLPKYKLLLS
jgi:hypothetical protein